MVEQHTTHEWERPTSFEAFLHDPFAYPSKKRIAAISAAKAKVAQEGLNIECFLTNLVRKHFGNYEKNDREGLKIAYQAMKEDVVGLNLIGIILSGSIDGSEDVLIHYTNVDKRHIGLCVRSVCRFLLGDYFKYKEVDDLCDRSY